MDWQYCDSLSSDFFKERYEFRVPTEAPVFEPTKEDFRDPLAYINKIRPIAEKCGICKIRPPPDWHPPFAVDIENFKFTPRVQRLNELEGKTRIKLNFLDQIAKFWELQGSPLKIPILEKKILDLYTLHRIVQSEGGIDTVSKEKKWRDVANKMSLAGASVGRAIGPVLKAHYEKILQPFDIFQATKIESTKKKHAGKDGPNVLKRLHIYGAGPKMAGYNKKQDKDEIITLEVVQEADPLAKYICQTCMRGDVEESMLLCDGCDDSYHTFCLTPPLTEIPKGDWRCPKCVAEEVSKPVDPFGFEQAKREYTLQEFGEMADQFKSDYFNMPVHRVSTALAEQEFWRIVSSLDDDITVEYGADLHSVVHGSGFPTRDTVGDTENPDIMEYVDSPWNLNNMPIVESSVLSHITASISGMKVPWMYVGMCFSTFCWHNEDHWSYSINYLHWGEPKTWYGVPGSCADEFEATMKRAAPELFQSQPDLLHQLTTIINPNVLMDAGVPVFRTDQNAGEFVITFPRAYHAGFNQGYNFAEAVNFAPADWLKIGRECIKHYATLRRYCVFSHDELVCKMALSAERLDPRIAAATYEDMLAMVETEKTLRKNLLEWGVCDAEREAYELVPDDARQCDFCKTTCFLSALTCSCTKNKLVCLSHYKLLCSCPPEKHILRYRYTMDELPVLLHKVKLKAESFDVWVSSVKKSLSRTGLDRQELQELKDLIKEAEQKGFPNSELFRSLQDAVHEAEKCISISQQLHSNRMRTRARFGNDSKMNLDELLLLREKVENLPCRIAEEDDLNNWTENALKFKSNALAVLTENGDIDIEKLTKCLDEGISLDLDFEEISHLKTLLSALKWIKTVENYLMFEEDLEVADIKELIKESIRIQASSSLSDSRKQVMSVYSAQLHILLKLSEAWEAQVQELFNSNPPAEFVVLENHLNDGRCLPVKLKGLPKLEKSVWAIKEWLRDAKILFEEETVTCLSEVEDLVSKAGKLPVTLPNVEDLKANLKFREEWMENACKKFLKDENDEESLLQVLFPNFNERGKPSVNISNLKDCVGLKTKSLERLYDNARMLEIAEVKALRVANRAQTLKDSDIPKCQACKAQRKQQPMTECNLCLLPYHESCTQKKTKKRRKNFAGTDIFICEVCERSKRPSLDSIESSVLDLKNTPIKFLEGETLRLFLDRIKSFQVRVSRTLSNAEVKKALEYIKNPKNLEPGKSEEIKKVGPKASVLEKVNFALSRRTKIKLQSMFVEGSLLEAYLEEPKVLLNILQKCKRAEKLNMKRRAELESFKDDGKGERLGKKALKENDAKTLSLSNKPHPRVRTESKTVSSVRQKRLRKMPSEDSEEDESEEDPCAAKPCLNPIENEVDWVQCDTCNLWFHLFCIGIRKKELNVDEDFVCGYCEQKCQGKKAKRKTTKR